MSSEVTPSPWERQPGETLKAFGAFRAYCQMGEDDRSFRALAHVRGCSENNVKKWGAEHAWAARAREYDSHRARVERDARDRVLAANAAKWEGRRQEAAEANWDVAAKLREKLFEMVARLEPDAKTPKTNPATINKLMRLAAMMLQLQRAALQEGEDDGFDPGAATAEELAEYLDTRGIKALPAPTGG